ncbi:glycosyltransferase family A protein, partial [Haloferax sp. KTX1]|uniref:glycosyltransferase family A protein n=1 Tax=Haloferax sp. KTX1 TaxID=2600597 RepID=UPI0011DCF477
NEGLGPTRNLGIEMAYSEYIYFFDSDDILPENFVEKIKKCLSEFDSDIIFFSGECFGNFGLRTRVPNYRRGVYRTMDKEEAPIREMRKKNILFPSACLYVSRKSIWIKNLLRFKAVVHEDEDVIFPLISFSSRITVIDDVLFYRRIR